MFAHFFGSKARGFVLIISTDPSNIRDGKEYKVSGKREAAALAKSLNAKPWNF